jgi:hypothetical protein
MRSKSNLAALIVTLFILAAATAPSASAAPPDNPCSLLTQAQVSAALGVSVDPGRLNTTALKACTWIVTGAGLKSLQVILRTADDHDKNKALMSLQAGAMAKAGKDNSIIPVVTPASGLGDDAYYTTTGRSATLSVKKGSVGFNVAVFNSDIPVDQQKSLEKDLAMQILSKL